jgi:predicted Zn-dependent protease
MKTRTLLFGVLVSGFCLQAWGQSYSVDWYKISGGGGTSTNGQYAISGTIGQHDASGAMAGGSYSVTGGFWSLISVVQTAGLPNLVITQNGNTVSVSWPNTGSYTLQQNANLAATSGWAPTGYQINTGNGTNSITITSPTGNLFFRLNQ